MTVVTTSLMAFYATEEKRATQAETILCTLLANDGLSSMEISEATRIPRTSVTGRLKKLEDEGRIYKAFTKKDPVTKMTVHCYKVVQ
ncbi:MAG: winged helix-turn-helix domain-containing protein [Candidatus Methanomethylophilaceae archaeon]|nr:winged helix-turn-helix domain-containing protein [Candidatus Methanomethylophilaceae archaeon]